MTDERYLLARKEEALKISDKLGLELEVIDGYTGKFANIGNGLVRLVSGDQMPFVGSDTTATTLELNSQESVEIVCYNSGKNKQLLVIGKALPAPTE